VKKCDPVHCTEAGIEGLILKMYSMYKFSSLFQGLLHDELLVSNITFSIVIEQKLVVNFCG